MCYTYQILSNCFQRDDIMYHCMITVVYTLITFFDLYIDVFRAVIRGTGLRPFVSVSALNKYTFMYYMVATCVWWCCHVMQFFVSFLRDSRQFDGTPFASQTYMYSDHIILT